MDDTTILGATLGQLGQTVKQGAKQIVKIPQELATDLGGQVGGVKPQDKPAENKPQQQWQSNEERIKFLRDLYGPTERTSSANPSEKSASFAKASAAKPDEQKKLLELRNQLHKENYYDPTFNPVKKQEERPAEKVENEKKQEIQELQQKKAEKPPPLAVVREQNKTEMFRGVAG